MRPEHSPLGDPCERCGKPAASHRMRVEHAFKGDRDGPCEHCSLSFADHRLRKRCRNNRGSGKRRSHDSPFYDTESVNDAAGKARIVYMSCYSRGEFIRHRCPEGISTRKALTWMIENLPDAAPIAWFFGGYDQTLILRDLPAMLHWALLHPEARRRPRQSGKGTELAPITWHGFELNMLSTEFTVRKGDKCLVFYDICRYYQCSFVKALKDWQIGTPEQLASIESGKASREAFDIKDLDTIAEYCDLEVKLGAGLWAALKQAHKDADLRPRKWLGPGQTAKALLTKVYGDVFGRDKAFDEGSKGEIRWQRTIRKAKQRIPKEASHAFACAFFGGRFENAQIGTVRKPLWSADIASAYPYALSQLPCIHCGDWRHVDKPIFPLSHALACVRYRLPPITYRESIPWAPLPWRDDDGSIAFGVNQSGWAWYPEIVQAIRLGFRPELLEAWVYDTPCDHRPYARHIPELYQFRIMIGKDGRGMVVKFALNSGYGVKAQVVGLSPFNVFQSFVEAGMITSTTRAMLLDAMTRIGPEHVLMVNTDSITADRKPTLDDSKVPGTDKPLLGSWDIEYEPEGMVLVKQGIYYSLSDMRRYWETQERDKHKHKRLKDRGIGRNVLAENAKQIRDALEFYIAGGPDTIELDNTRSMFWGQRICTDRTPKGFRKRDYYGTWERNIQQRITFTPLPKRERVLPDGRLTIRDLGGRESMPYSRALGLEKKERSYAGQLAEVYELAMRDQPGGSWSVEDDD